MMRIDTTVDAEAVKVAPLRWPPRTRVAACALVAFECLLAYAIGRRVWKGAILGPSLLGYVGAGAYFLFRSSLFQPYDSGMVEFYERVHKTKSVKEETVRNLYKRTSVTSRYVVDPVKKKRAAPSIGNDIRVACAVAPVDRWSYAALKMLIDAADDVERYAPAVGYRVQQLVARRYRYWQVVVARMCRGDKVVDLTPYADYIRNGVARRGLWVGYRIEEVVNNGRA